MGKYSIIKQINLCKELKIVTQELFQVALNITEPWFVSDLKFDVENKRLDVYIDFKRGSVFNYTDKETSQVYQNLKAYDVKNKVWRHLNI